MAAPKTQKLNKNSDIEEWVKAIKEFFLSKFNIELWNVYLYTTMKDENPILYPLLTNNQLTKDDIEEIRNYFMNELGMHEDGIGFKYELKELRKKGITNTVMVLSFYYDISFQISIRITYFRISKKEYFFLNLIEIEKMGKKMDKIMREVAEKIFSEEID